MKIFVVPVNCNYHCPADECLDKFEKINSLRKHCQRNHEFSVVTYKKKVKSIQETRQRQRGYTASYRSRKKKDRRLRVRKKFHTTLTIEDANERGFLGCEDPIVEYRQSLIEGAGIGVFALEELQPGDFVTWISGYESIHKPDDYSYTIYTKNGKMFNGIKTPIEGEGLGSFVNREQRTMPKARKNCVIVECFGERHKIYIEVVKSIKAGQELYTIYDRGYRIKKN